MHSTNTLAPGTRDVIRDEEWLIRCVDPATDGGWLLTCDGISELVRGQSALFLTALENKIEVLELRSFANMIEVMVVAYCKAHGVSIEGVSNEDTSTGKQKKTT